MSTAFCFNQLSNENDMDIAPQMKRMKLNNINDNYAEKDILLSSLNFVNNPLDNIKNAYPSINENMIKEILEKSDNNIEGAKQLISEFKRKHTQNNPKNISFHQTNRKRCYGDAFSNSKNFPSDYSYPNLHSNSNLSFNVDNINSSSLHNPFEKNKLEFSHSTNNSHSNKSSTLSERRVIKFNNKIYPFNKANVNFSGLINRANIDVGNHLLKNENPNNKTTNNQKDFGVPSSNCSGKHLKSIDNKICDKTDIINDDALETLLAEVSQINSKEDIKAYLKKKITNFIDLSSNKEEKISKRGFLLEDSSSSVKIEIEKISQLEKNLTNLEASNKQLKKIICTIYDKYENVQKRIQNEEKRIEQLEKENQLIKEEKEKVEIALMKEKTDHNILKEFIRQFDDSKGYNVPNTRHIY